MSELEFVDGLKNENLLLNEDQLVKFEKYYKLLLEENSKYNLTAITSKDDVYLKHFFDSAQLIRIIDLNKIKTLADIGSGAGFPGIVLKIIFPNLCVTLIESNNKKVKFLEKIIKELELTDIFIIKDRSENYARTNREKFDIVTARAVADLRILSEICMALVIKGGYFISYKGKIENELKESESTIQILGGKIDNIVNFNLPTDKGERSLIKIKKIKNTDIKYPRLYDKIKKNPLKK